MKISRLHKFAWAFFALALSTTTVFSQGWKNGNRRNQESGIQKQTCLNYIQNLTEEQVTEIGSLGATHKEAMNELRNQRRSTSDAIAKSEIRVEMLQKVEAHKNEVRNVLTAEQQKAYDAFPLQNYSMKNRGNRVWNGRQGNQQDNAFAGNCINVDQKKGKGKGNSGLGKGNGQKGKQGNGRRGKGTGRCFNS